VGIGVLIPVGIEDRATVIGHSMEAAAAHAFEHACRGLDGLLEAFPVGRLVVAKENEEVFLV
jgi:hypothetical protein